MYNPTNQANKLIINQWFKNKQEKDKRISTQNGKNESAITVQTSICLLSETTNLRNEVLENLGFEPKEHDPFKLKDGGHQFLKGLGERLKTLFWQRI